MNTGDQLFENPKLRQGVVIDLHESQIDVDYRQQGCSIDVVPEAREQALGLFTALQHGASVRELMQSFPGFSEQLPKIIRDLDRLGLWRRRSVQRATESSRAKGFTAIFATLSHAPSSTFAALHYSTRCKPGPSVARQLSITSFSTSTLYMPVRPSWGKPWDIAEIPKPTRSYAIITALNAGTMHCLPKA